MKQKRMEKSKQEIIKQNLYQNRLTKGDVTC